MEKDSVTMVKKIALAIVTMLIIAYVISVAVKANFTQIKTESAALMTVSDSIPATGYFIRDESLIKYDGSGVISYTVEDGDKISVGEPVAKVFKDSEAASDKRTIDKLEQQAANLEQLEETDKTVMQAPDVIDKNISTNLSGAKINASKKNFTEADKCINTALYSINQRQLVTQKTEDFSDKVEQLKKKAEELKKKYPSYGKEKSVLSTKTGYFSSVIDGYENYFSTDDIDSLEVGSLDDSKLVKKNIDENVVGKTIVGVYWYIACEVSADEAIQIKNAYSLSVDIPMTNNHNISVELEEVRQKTKSSRAVVILKGSYMNKDMINLRKEDIAIVKNTYEGIYVPRNAVHEQRVTEEVTDQNGKTTTETKTVEGVYIMIGNELQFKQIVPLYTGDGYIICKQNPQPDDLVTQDIGLLKAYDDVVVEGANLYDGKIVERTSNQT